MRDYEIKLSFGAVTDRLSEQLDKQGFKYKTQDIVELQLSADAIVRLYIHGIVTGAQFDKLNEKIAKKVGQHVARENKAVKP